jgi:hypothetical protein
MWIFLGFLIVLAAASPATTYASSQTESWGSLPALKVLGRRRVWTYNPPTVSKSTAVRLACHHTEIFARKELLLGLAILWMLETASYWLEILSRKEFLLFVLGSVAVYLLVVVITLLYNVVWSERLPRRLSRGQKSRIIKYLEKYRDDGRIVQVKICYHPDAEEEKEARDYADDIISAIRQSGWRADRSDQVAHDEPEHSSGLWVYGLNQRGLQEPLTRAIIATAFNKARVEMNQNRETKMGWTCIVVGHREKGGH